MTRHNWARVTRKGVQVYHCQPSNQHCRTGADCFSCEALVLEVELVRWTNFLPKELNAALDEIVGVRQQVKKELTT